MKIDAEWIIFILIIGAFFGSIVWNNLNDGLTMKEKKILDIYKNELRINTNKIKFEEWKEYCENGFPISLQKTIDMDFAYYMCLNSALNDLD